jgi:leader peptidase (prepilin peptidase)/N-methyltransferase
VVGRLCRAAGLHRCHRAPAAGPFTYLSAAGTWTLLGLAALASGSGAGWLRALVGGVVAALLLATSTLLLGPRGFGLGDAKLALGSVAVLGWLGWGSVVWGLMVAFATSAAYSLILLAARRVSWSDHLPFGPFLILGTFAGLALAP